MPPGHAVLEGVYESVVEHLSVAVKRLALVRLRATVRRWTGDCLALVLLGDEALPHGDAVATTLELFKRCHFENLTTSRNSYTDRPRTTTPSYIKLNIFKLELHCVRNPLKSLKRSKYFEYTEVCKFEARTVYR